MKHLKKMANNDLDILHKKVVKEINFGDLSTQDFFGICIDGVDLGENFDEDEAIQKLEEIGLIKNECIVIPVGAEVVAVDSSINYTEISFKINNHIFEIDIYFDDDKQVFDYFG